MKKQSIFDIQDDFDALFWMAEEERANSEDGTISEETQKMLDDFERELATSLADKADNYIYVMRDAEGRADTIKAEIKRLKALETSYRNKSARLKTMLRGAMMFMKMDKLVTKLHKLSLAKAGGKQKLEINCKPEDLPDYFIDMVPQIDKDALREALADGEQIDGVQLLPREMTLRIK